MTAPYQITPKILKLVGDIQELLGELKSVSMVRPSVRLRKENKIRTIHHSLAIEGNNLSEEQVTALLDDKRVIGTKKEILEVKNAFILYEKIDSFKAIEEKDLLKAHKILMKDLIQHPGEYRSGNIGIFKGKKIGHIAPQSKFVPKLMGDLFKFIKTSKEIPFLLKACIFHYELEFIHPFEDGNGRMGRLWQQLLLVKHDKIFEYLSVESLIHREQKKYYNSLEASDKAGDCTLFIEFSLELIHEALTDFKKSSRPVKPTNDDRIAEARNYFGKREFSRKEYMEIHRNISTATASRDLAKGVKDKILEIKGDKALALYKFRV